MNSTQTAVVATLTVRVPLGAAGSLAEGAVDVLERIGAVDAVNTVDIRGVSPALNETTVDLEARLFVVDRVADESLARRELESGVGVRAVDRVEEVDEVEADTPPLAEVG
ncbi:uncharacterized protein Nmag_3040 [Natrialba magadii ATCC 43099]|uniref:Uncharacterized protein n=1 Tax=Natrialba magadii (strain ATCC 43099 / DSM 3394 / CCM 3739 / CIP 104546 / IAM 13178 / JCM 8861 / NBRC 102185 / NCIMB 2190 / MS3) TaxID=547559 RepID=D3SR36_NATMM|nr:hypothetical protein [Natrialba magadii]ADD06592.1 uncharacterized protein Nmag_3040 [Natrialba magadii ATCC 43099]ELY31947.1 hypothetical protein C500_05198 [Natrialba magadii ATCC 43099]